MQEEKTGLLYRISPESWAWEASQDFSLDRMSGSKEHTEPNKRLELEKVLKRTAD